jgi:hypothetical protein
MRNVDAERGGDPPVLCRLRRPALSFQDTGEREPRPPVVRGPVDESPQCLLCAVQLRRGELGTGVDLQDGQVARLCLDERGKDPRRVSGPSGVENA